MLLSSIFFKKSSFDNLFVNVPSGLKDLINEFPKKELPGTQAEVCIEPQWLCSRL